MEIESLKELKENSNFKHENNRISINDDICFMAIATEFSNKNGYKFDDKKRIALEDFAEFLENYFEVCDGNEKWQLIKKYEVDDCYEP